MEHMFLFCARPGRFCCVYGFLCDADEERAACMQPAFALRRRWAGHADELWIASFLGTVFSSVMMMGRF